MGCEIVVGGASPTELNAVERLFRERDLIFSRFHPGSELNRVNRGAGTVVRTTRVFARTLQIALDLAAETRGLLDPTVGSALETAGYSADFELLPPDGRPVGPGRRGSWRSVRTSGRLVRTPRDVRLDLNGVVKALSADDALALLSGPGFVSAGGDLAVRGGVGVGLPGGGSVQLAAGGLATSGSGNRRWLRGGIAQHHLIDPRIGSPARSPWEQVTACGKSCLDADAAAKAAFLAGDDGPDWLDRREIPGRFLAHDGRVTVNGTWRRAVPEPVCI
jgi:thiamine biosynthesis lipoprotein